ncbi:MAG: hypothetical protein BEN19_06960 [Epulopiscium sp. Nuni2H_MBin003]|nr:MAG: hypothetical protein BEN19_06960 [Epulopiscium sp. Nuni2H_MBin003]
MLEKIANNNVMATYQYAVMPKEQQQTIIFEEKQSSYEKQAEQAQNMMYDSSWFNQLEMNYTFEEDMEQLAKSGVNIEDLAIDDYEYIKETQDVGQVTSKDRAKVERLKEHTDGMYKTAIQQEDAITVNSLYMGSFTTVNTTSFTNDNVLHVLQMNNLPDTTGNVWAAGKLMSIGEDVSRANVVKMQNLYNAIELMDLPTDDGELSNLEKATKTIIEEEKVMYVEKDMQDIVDIISGAKDSDIQRALDTDGFVTINNLRESMHINTEKALGKISEQNNDTLHKMANEDYDENSPDIKDVIDIKQPSKIDDIKEQIEIIRAKLTVQAARNISAKMPLESTELSKIATELTNNSQNMMERAAKNANLELTKENKDTLEVVLATVTQMQYSKESSLTLQIQSSEEATLSEFNQVLSKYKEQELTPEARFKENISTVKDQIQSVLEQNDLPINPLSIQSATALILNEQEITLESLEDTMVIANKMNTFFEEMTPNIAASMIKEGINPYYSNIDTILSFVAENKAEDNKKSVAQAIVALSENGQINDTQKDELIGLYQVLNSIENNKEQVIGYLQKNNLPLTINRLQEAVKYVNDGNLEAIIDDMFGEIEGYKRKSTKQKIDDAREINKDLLEATKIVENSKLSNNTTDLSTKIQSMIYPFVKSALKQELGNFKDMDTLPDSLLEKMNVAKNASSAVIDKLNEKNIPVTINNIYLMDKFMADPNEFSEILKQKMDTNEYFPKSFLELEEELEEIYEDAYEQKQSALAEGDINSYKQNKSIEEVTQFTKTLNDQDGVYQIPFIISGEARTVNLYVKDKAKALGQIKDELNAVISYDTKNMGTVVANLKITPDTVKYEISAKDDYTTNKLSNKSQNLNKMIEEIGYKVKEALYMADHTYEPVLQSTPSVKPSSDSQFEEIV